MIDSLYQLIAKIGFTDPLHAPLTHIPIGLVIGAFLFILVGVIFNRKNLITTARHVAILAFLFVFPTILFGVLDWLHFFKGALIAPIKYKMILASSVLVLLAIGIVLGSEVRIHAAPMVVIYALAFVGVVGLGYFGGKLVYGGFAPGSGQTAQAFQGGGKTTPAAPAGQKLFVDNCAACHPSGGNIVVPNLPMKTSKKLVSAAVLTAFIRAPKMPDGSQGGMPSFPADQISDTQAASLYTYISSMLSSWK
jgi:mono/diheme cytochrome c family protein